MNMNGSLELKEVESSQRVVLALNLTVLTLRPLGRRIH